MYIKKIKLKNFRNYDNLEIELDKNFNIIYGNNAQGKTNIIESVYVSAIGRSFRTKRDNELIKLNSENASIEVDYKKEDREGSIKTEINDKKMFFINGIKQKKISDIIGNIKIVLFNPDDINIIKSSPSLRRKFLDIMISQLKPNYLHILNTYLRALEQRNFYLKQIKFENKPINMLDIWDEKLSELNYEIFKYREKYLNIIRRKNKRYPQKYNKLWIK
ncbi:MAG: DNA replication and repair protein RecF [Clostridia bacterium]|nr:DNA replication and repair protein RecF [Clostridia bacterium]